LVRLLTILIVPLIYFYAINFWQLILSVNLNDNLQLAFWISFLASTIISFITIGGHSYIAIFQHELTHNLFAVLTFQKPTGFHVWKGAGGYFEYKGKSNFLITLSPYFFLTFSFALLLLFLWIKTEVYLYFFIILGITMGFYLSTVIKQVHPGQQDIKANGYLFSYTFIILGNILTYGLLIAFTIGRWSKMGMFIKSGVLDLVGWIGSLITSI